MALTYLQVERQLNLETIRVWLGYKQQGGSSTATLKRYLGSATAQAGLIR